MSKLQNDRQYNVLAHVYALYTSSCILCELWCLILIDAGAYQEIPDVYEESDLPPEDGSDAGLSLISQLKYENRIARTIIGWKAGPCHRYSALTIGMQLSWVSRVERLLYIRY